MMNKNFVVVELPLIGSGDFIDISKKGFFGEAAEALKYIESIIFEETGNYVSLSGKPSEISIKLPDKIIELWVCHLPDSSFLN